VPPQDGQTANRYASEQKNTTSRRSLSARVSESRRSNTIIGRNSPAMRIPSSTTHRADTTVR
jgi:hypothetical protein